MDAIPYFDTLFLPSRVLADRLIVLAEDSERAGLRPEAVLILDLVYAVLDRGSEE